MNAPQSPCWRPHVLLYKRMSISEFIGCTRMPLEKCETPERTDSREEKSSASVNNTVKTLIIVFNSTTVWVQTFTCQRGG